MIVIHRVPCSWSLALALLSCLCLANLPLVFGKANTFFYNPVQPSQPQLILISGCTGGLLHLPCAASLILSQAPANPPSACPSPSVKVPIQLNFNVFKLSLGILRCLSTDSIRQVLRTTKTDDPALFRSSYQGEGAISITCGGLHHDAADRRRDRQLAGHMQGH